MKRPKAAFQFFDANRKRINRLNVRHPAVKMQAKAGLRSIHDWPFFAFHNKNFF